MKSQLRNMWRHQEYRAPAKGCGYEHRRGAQNRPMKAVDDDLRHQVHELVDAYRDRCLWFLRTDYYPADRDDMLRALDYIRRYGDREAFRRASELAQWLSPLSNDPSAVS